MCGIMGFVGGRDALPIVVDGLRRLEYRGYDSSGVVVLDGSGFAWEKCTGKLEALVRRLEKRPLPGALGIGHTRWATHGGVTEINAHPHFSCDRRITLVHNGIIENYAELKKRLAGHRFRSQTDTEIIAHLIEDRYRGDPLEAVTAAARELHGTFALVVAFADHPDLLVGARLNAPLVVGLGGRDTLFASDVAALLAHTRRVAHVEDGQAVLIRRASGSTGQGPEIRAVDFDGRPSKLRPVTVTWSLADADKHGHDHFYHKEIFEQPATTRAELQGRLDLARGAVRFDGIPAALGKCTRAVVTACGTAWHAGLVTKYALEELAGLPTEVGLASEMRYGDQPYDRATLLLAISQSGETADTLAAVRQARRAGARTLAITNVKGSTLSRDAEHVIYMRAGLEIGVAATKTYTSQVLCGLLWAIQMGRWRRKLPASRAKHLLSEARRVPAAIQKVLDDDAVRPISRLFARQDCRDFMYIGRRYNLATAYEGALKMKELSYLHAEGYGAGEMKHGPLAIVDEKLYTVAIAPFDSVFPKMVSNIQQIRSRGGPVVSVTTTGHPVPGLAGSGIQVPRVEEIFTPLVTVVPLQLLAYDMAIRHGRDVDQPRNLAKSVTVE